MKKTIVVSVFGGPSTGKSSLRADVFARLKWLQVSCEEAIEYVKFRVWENSPNSYSNQFYVFAKQHNQLFILNGKVDVIITDAPLLNSILYDKTNDKLFRSFVLREFKKYNNMNFLINRNKPYDPKGREQNEEGARKLDIEAEKMLKKYNIKYEKVPGGPECAQEIVNKILKKLKK